MFGVGIAPERESALTWLMQQNSEVHWPDLLSAAKGAPLLAKEMHDQQLWPLYQKFNQDLKRLGQGEADPIALAAEWKEQHLLWLLEIFFHWVAKEIRWVLESAPKTSFVQLEKLFKFLDLLQETQMEILRPFNLNQQLLLEKLFIQWVEHAVG